MLECGRMARPRIFVSYSHADIKQKERLLKHLSVLDGAADFDVWTDDQIRPGEKWEPVIEFALSNSSIAILLISADFLSSDFVRRREIPAILERREKQDLRLYPILAKSCAWQAVPWIKEIQIRPVAAKPVWRSGGKYADDELARITLELFAITELARQAQEAADAAGRQKAEQERREKEKAIAEVIASSPSVETIELEANEIAAQMEADYAKQRMDRWDILQDTQAKIFDIMQDVTLNRSRKMDDAYKRWDEYIRQ
jgi:nucleotide-binding universal stress UspA family protein